MKMENFLIALREYGACPIVIDEIDWDYEINADNNNEACDVLMQLDWEHTDQDYDYWDRIHTRMNRAPALTDARIESWSDG